MSEFFVKKRNGRLEKLNLDKINKCVVRACNGINDVSASEVILDAQVQLFNKITTNEIDKALIMSARSKIEKDPGYSIVAARLLLNTIYKEVFGEGVDSDVFGMQYHKSFVTNLKALEKAGRIDKKMLSEFDLNKIAKSLDPNRDSLWKYLGIQTVYDRYLLHINGRRMETPQGFWMRVAMGLAINEENKDEKAIEFYDLLSMNLFINGTPTLFNSGTTHPQLSSCYLSTVDDSINGIFGTIHNQACLSKFAGGLGVDWTPIRGSSSHINGTNGKSQGLVPWLKIFNDTLVAVNQGGRRKGAGCAYLETWHTDVEDFLELRKNTGDDRRRCHDMHTANWIPDLFMKRAKEDGDWYLFSPSDCPDLHDLFGKDFDKAYLGYCKKAENGDIPFKKISAKSLWKKMLVSLFETGHPWITFKDPSNIRYSNQHVGTVHSSNLCTEILLHTKPTIYDLVGDVTEIGETAVCNLGSVNLAAHINDGRIDYDKLAKTISVAMRMLDNVIDINFYPTKESKKSNTTHRPVGLGIMGFHDTMHLLNIDYESDAAVQESGRIQEFISYHAILNSSILSKERGKYSTYDGSLWSLGKLPQDTHEEVMKYRGNEERVKETLDWSVVRKHIAEHGMRNSNTMAIAPTATISYIAGCSQSIEPDFSVLFVYSTLSGEFTMVSDFFAADMKKRGLWGKDLTDAVKAVDGDIELLNLPDDVKKKYKTAFRTDPLSLIKCAAARQVWIDQGQSLNIYADTDSLKSLNDIYMHGWEKGLKTTYYLRAKSASRIEKSTSSKISNGYLNGDQPALSLSIDQTAEVKACSLEAKMRGEICEACQ